MKYYDLVSKPEFFSFLLEIDRSIAAEAHGRPCRHCGGKLDVGNFRRTGYGLPAEAGEECRIRFSFCCREDGCRKREMPGSLRFLWGKAYASIVVVLVSALRHGLSPSRVKELTTSCKVSRQTVANWLKWWRERFPSTPFWKAGRAGFMPPLDEAKLSLSLLEVFGGRFACAREGVRDLLRFLAGYPRAPR